MFLMVGVDGTTLLMLTPGYGEFFSLQRTLLVAAILISCREVGPFDFLSPYTRRVQGNPSDLLQGDASLLYSNSLLRQLFSTYRILRIFFRASISFYILTPCFCVFFFGMSQIHLHASVWTGGTGFAVLNG
jgi:hypothetical protein